MNGQTSSTSRRFVRAAWLLLAFQLIAAMGATGLAVWAAMKVQAVIDERDAMMMRVHELEAREAPAPEPTPEPVADEPLEIGPIEETEAPSAPEATPAPPVARPRPAPRLRPQGPVTRDPPPPIVMTPPPAPPPVVEKPPVVVETPPPPPPPPPRRRPRINIPIDIIFGGGRRTREPQTPPRTNPNNPTAPQPTPNNPPRSNNIRAQQPTTSVPVTPNAAPNGTTTPRRRPRDPEVPQ